MSLNGKLICRVKDNKKLGTIIKENKVSFSYGIRKYVKKKDYGITWKVCDEKKVHYCNNNRYIAKTLSGKLPIRLHRSIYEMTKDCFPTFKRIPFNDFVNYQGFLSDPRYVNFWLEDPINKNEMIAFLTFDTKESTIWHVCTNKKYRKQNCFKTLYNSFYSRIKKMYPVLDRIYLWVLKDNKLAINVYKKLGYNIVGYDETSYKMLLLIPDKIFK